MQDKLGRKEKAHGFSKDFPPRLETSSNEKVSQVCCLCPPRTHLIEGDKVYVQKRAAVDSLWPLLAFADEAWSQLAFPGDVCKVYFAKLAESSRKKGAKSFQPLSSATAGDIRLFPRFQFLCRGKRSKNAVINRPSLVRDNPPLSFVSRSDPHLLY